MPNYVKNIITVEGDKSNILKMLNNVKYDDNRFGLLDFNKIIPMPKSLDIESGSLTDIGLKEYKEFLEQYIDGKMTENVLDCIKNIPEQDELLYLELHRNIDPDEWNLGKTAFCNIQKYGYPTWYEWCIHNWGTKWNSCGAYGDKNGTFNPVTNSFCFRTAWSAPHPVIKRLSEIYPDIEFTHDYADEDIGSYNCGCKRYLGGNIEYKYIPENRKDAIEFALGVWGYDTKDIGLRLNDDETDYEWEEIL